MGNTIRTLWLSDAIELIMRDDCNEIDVKGKKFALIKHGHWERIEDDFGSIWQCSNCEAESTCSTRYCAHCGAKMDEVMSNE